jgi:hypothetical protein
VSVRRYEFGKAVPLCCDLDGKVGLKCFGDTLPILLAAPQRVSLARPDVSKFLLECSDDIVQSSDLPNRPDQLFPDRARLEGRVFHFGFASGRTQRNHVSVAKCGIYPLHYDLALSPLLVAPGQIGVKPLGEIALDAFRLVLGIRRQTRPFLLVSEGPLVPPCILFFLVNLFSPPVELSSDLALDLRRIGGRIGFEPGDSPLVLVDRQTGSVEFQKKRASASVVLHLKPAELEPQRLKF